MSFTEYVEARLAFRPYTLHFTLPVKMARGTIFERRGLIIRLEANGKHGYGELLPLEHFGTESFEAAVNYLNLIASESFTALKKVPENLPATKFALEAALFDLTQSDTLTYHRKVMPLSKLLPSNDKVFDIVKAGLKEGYTIFKMKIGIRSFADELADLKELVSYFNAHEKVRLDANEGLSVDEARRWLTSIESLPVEFLEQPLKRDMLAETIKLSEDFSTPIALDEAIACTQDMIYCWNEGFRGIYATKPLRIGELQRFLDWRKESKAKISYSTVFETAIGSIFGIRLAASDPVNQFGLGFGVSHLFSDKGLVLASEAEYRIDEIGAIDRDSIWQQLSSDTV